MPFFDDPGFWKRAQIAANDLALAGVASFADIDRLTVFADNLVPHVLRIDGVLRYDPELAARVDAGCCYTPAARWEREIRACAVHACELLAGRLGVPPRAQLAGGAPERRAVGLTQTGVRSAARRPPREHRYERRRRSRGRTPCAG
jgi:hypothetical protein